jgi:Subtilase family
MSDDRSHFEIPKENIRSEKYEKTGGGESFQRLNHSDHGKKLMEQTIRLKQVEFTKKDSKYSSDIFFQIETPKDLSVKGEKLRLERLGFEIINFAKENKSIGTAKINKDLLPSFEERLIEYTDTAEHIGKSYFSVIEDIVSVPMESKIKPVIDFSSEEKISIVINLYNALSVKERLAINNTIIEEIKKYTDTVSQRNFRNGITSIACVLRAKEIPLIVDEFSTIKEIKQNYITFVENSFPVQEMPNPLTIDNTLSNSAICIIDSGIRNANGIFDNLITNQILKLPFSSIDCHYDHGTFVASRCVFGDNIDSCLGSHRLTPYCKLLDVAVFGKDSTGRMVNPDEFHLRSAIEDIVVQFYQTIKVYNLSLGSSIPIADFEFSELAKLLDYLAKAYKVLFVICSGNINNQLGSFPVDHFSNAGSRIGVPAESLLSLTIGSVAKYSDGNSLAEVNEVSPFSRIGPGSDLGIKPELVAHGGNLISPYSYSPRVSTYGISTDGRNLAVNIGTSFSAPIVSQYAQKLFDLYPNSDPNIVKALLCHFSEARAVYDEITTDLINYTGFGEPNIDKALEAGDFNAAYIFEGLLDQENYQFISFHIPTTLSAGLNAKLKVKITITYDPPVNPDNEAEYSNARISAQLTKLTEAGIRPIMISSDDKYQLPWNPIIRFEKSFSRSYLTGIWELRLRLYTRGNMDEKYLQDFAVVIEIIDEGKSTNVYNDIISQFSDIYKKIQLKRAA